MTEQTSQECKDFEMIESYNVLKHRLYCIVDFKSLSILPPFLAQNDDEAVRNFTNLVNYSNSTICRFPEDFRLYKLCDYDVAYTGNYDFAREKLSVSMQSYQFIASADLLKRPDTIKYDELCKKAEEALAKVSNSNQVLVEQVGKVPNLSQQINLLSSKLSALSDEFEHYKNQEFIVSKDSKKSFLDKLFS